MQLGRQASGRAEEARAGIRRVAGSRRQTVRMAETGGGVGTKGVPRADREQQILDAAVAEFGEFGYAHASVAAIARRAGISKPLVYEYFGSKDGLYLACLGRAGSHLAVRDAALGYRARLHGLAAEGTREVLGGYGLTDAEDSALTSHVWMTIVTAVVTWWLGHPGETAAAMTDRCNRVIAALSAAGGDPAVSGER